MHSNLFLLDVALQAVRGCGMGWGLAPRAQLWGTQFITGWGFVEAEGVALPGCLVMKGRNIVFHPLTDFIFSVKYKYCI